MQNIDERLLLALRDGRVSRNKDLDLLAQGKGRNTYRLHQRFLGLSRHLQACAPRQQHLEKIKSDQIRLEIKNLPGNGREIAYLSMEEAALLTVYAIPAWARRAISAVLGGN